MMFAAAMAGVLAAMALTLVRGLLGPTVFDRVLALNTFGTVTVLAIAVLGFLMGRPQFLDIAPALCADQFRRHHRDPEISAIRRSRRFRPGGRHRRG